MSQTKTRKQDAGDTLLAEVYSLILWNDDVNSFDEIIDALIEFCGHEPMQAEQCAMIAHYKGKCDIMSGEPFSKLQSVKGLFDHRKINTSIE